MGEAFLDYKKGGSGLDINGIIKDYYVYAGGKVNAGDFVEFINGVAGKVDYGANPSTVFLTSNLQNICSCLIDTNKVLVVFGDNTAGNCKAVVATVNGAEITFGTIYTVNSTKVDYISMTFVSTNKVAISYSYGGYLAQVAIITVSGTAITVGTALTVGSGSSSYPDYWTQVIALDETHLLVTWDRNRNSSSTTYGLKACVLTINNTTLSAGTVLSLEGYQHYYLSLCKLNSTSAILFYGDAQNSEYGTARVLQISGTTITSGSEYVFQNSRTLCINSCLVDTNKVMISYCDNGNSNTGKAIIAKVSGTSVTFGSVYTLPINRNNGGMATIDTNKAMLVYRDYNQAGTAITATVSGTVIEFGTPYTFSNLINNVYFGVTMISDDTALVAYANYVDSTKAEGTAQLLGILGAEISNNITETAYETQVRPATTLPCKGVAKSSGEGGDETGHKDIVSISIPPVLASLPVGTLVRDTSSTFLGEPVIWKIADVNHEGYPSNSVTLITDKVVAMRAFDAKEPSNSNSQRQELGNNRYSLSNIRQWLNSDAEAGRWYSAQHSSDMSPSSGYVDYNAYTEDTGFLNGFSQNFKKALLETNLIVAKNTGTDGGGSEIVNDKMFLASNTEVGLPNENSIAEGVLFSMFSDATSRITYCTAKAIEDNEYTGDGTDENASIYWRTRTPITSSACATRCVNKIGYSGSSNAFNGSYGVRPLCNIPSSIAVSKSEDGIYDLVFN